MNTGVLSGLIRPAGPDVGGWTADPRPWRRTGNAAFSIDGYDATTYIGRSTKVRWKEGSEQAAWKYGGVSALPTYTSPSTSVVLLTNTDYTMSAGPILSPGFSNFPSPVGFPDWFTIDGATFWGTAGSNTVYDWTRCRVGAGVCDIRAKHTRGANTTPTSGAITLTVPVSIANAAALTPLGQWKWSFAAGSPYFGLIQYASSTTLTLWFLNRNAFDILYEVGTQLGFSSGGTPQAADYGIADFRYEMA